MSIKTVLTITGPEQSKIDLRLAAQLCGEISAHLSVMVTALAVPPPLGEYPPAAEDWMKQRDQDLTNLRRRTREVTKFLADTILSADVTDAYPDRGLGDEVIGRRARYADITLLGPEVLADEWLKRKSIEGVLFHSGKPLLLAPFEGSPTMKPRRVLVAWDSLLASSRAVREALELITGADETRIVLIDPAKGETYHGDEPGADIAAYLTRHGARITVDRLPVENRSVTEMLKEHAMAFAADLLVMGAYGHSRFREYLFGGVTRNILDDPFMPTLMAR